jgi:hypothetical protein
MLPRVPGPWLPSSSSAFFLPFFPASSSSVRSREPFSASPSLYWRPHTAFGSATVRAHRCRKLLCRFVRSATVRSLSAQQPRLALPAILSTSHFLSSQPLAFFKRPIQPRAGAPLLSLKFSSSQPLAFFKRPILRHNWIDVRHSSLPD